MANYHQKKCEHCTLWTDGSKHHCAYCGGILDEKYKAENTARKLKKPEPPIIKIYPEDGWFMVGFKRVVQFHQLVFYWIVSIVIYFITWVVF